MIRILFVSWLVLCSFAWSVPQTVVVPLSVDTTDGSIAASLASTVIAAAYDARDYNLQIASPHGTPVPSAGAHTYAWHATVTCQVDRVVQAGGTNFANAGWSVDPGVSGSGSNVVLKLSSLDTSLAWLWTAVYPGDSDNDGFDDVWEASVGLVPGVNDSAIASYIRNHSSTFGLYTSNAVLDLRVGDIGVTASNGSAYLNLQIEQSDDLSTWTNAGDAVEWSLPVSGEKKFFRIRAQ